MKKQTLLFISIILLVISIVIVSQVYLKNNTGDKSQNTKSPEVYVVGKDQIFATPTPVTNNVEIKIDFGNGTVWSETVDAKTVYAATVSIAQTHNTAVEAKKYKNGILVEKIGDISGTASNYWAYWVNGKPGLIASDKMNIKSGDKIEWKYTSLK